MMIETVFAALAGTLIAAASPAAARADAEPVAAPAAPAAPAPADVAPVAKKTRYCVSDTVTGSRLPVKSCRTRDEWLAMGFDPLKK